MGSQNKNKHVNNITYIEEFYFFEQQSSVW